MTNYQIISARFVLPVSSEPLLNGAVCIHNETIADTGYANDLLQKYPHAELLELNNRILMPALVNPHTHISLSDAQIANTGNPFPDWLFDLMSYRKNLSPLDFHQISASGLKTVIRNGITTIADSDPTLIPLKAALKMNFRGLFFFEVFGLSSFSQLFAKLKYASKIHEGFSISNKHTRFGISPHTPYTVTPAIFRFAAQRANQHNLPVSVHVAESVDEIEFLNSNTGKYRDFFSPMANRIPVTNLTPLMYVNSYGILNSQFLCIHGVHLTDIEFRLLSQIGASLVTCPSSNRNLQTGQLNIEKPLNHGVNLCIGTDSPASSDGYDLFHELRLALNFNTENQIRMNPNDSLKLITINSAKAIGFETEIGSLQTGKSADMIAIDIHNTISDHNKINEYIIANTISDHICLTISKGKTLYSNL